VPDHEPRISRRRILQIAALTPLASLAGSGTSEAAALANPSYKPINDKTMEALVVKSGLTDPNEQTAFKQVVEELWLYCRVGATYGGHPLPEPDSDDTLNGKSHARLLAAYDTKNLAGHNSGNLVVQRLKNWDVLRELTNVCAFNCGRNAAKYALAQKTEIDDAAYQFGFRQTEVGMKSLMNRVRSVHESQGKLAPEFLGGGC
jgi:hypothetical protein